jgi:hypothetical protein
MAYELCVERVPSGVIFELLIILMHFLLLHLTLAFLL